MTNILAATPKTNPSLLNSSAGDTTALAKPVIGTRVPAPACLAILSKTPRPVRIAESRMSVTDTAAAASSFSRAQLF